MSYLNPDFKITILPFNAPKGKEYDMPQSMIGSITSSRSLTGNSISMNIPNGMQNLVGLKRFKEVFHDQCIVRLYVRKNPSEAYRQLNVGYMHGLSVNLEAMGKVNWSIQFPGLEQKLQNQELFIDMAKRDSEGQALTTSKNANSFSGAFNDVSKALSGSTGMKKLLIGLWDNVIVDLVGKFTQGASQSYLYGGYELLRKWNGNLEDSDALITPFFANGFTENSSTKYNIFSMNQIGSSPKFWEVITSMATQPLYECFIDTLDTLGSDDALFAASLSSTETYTVGEKSVNSLVFRKTPFDDLFDIFGAWEKNFDYKKINYISSISFSENPDDIYSGIHVGSTEPDLAGEGSALLFPAKWSSILKKRYGYRVMQVKLDGITFGLEETNTTVKRTEIKKAFQTIQDRLFDIFLPSDTSPTGKTYLKNVTSNVNCAFDYFRPGNGLDMGEHEAIDFYGRYGYLTGVTDSFNPMGSATSSLQLKWVDNKEDLLPKF